MKSYITCFIIIWIPLLQTWSIDNDLEREDGSCVKDGKVKMNSFLWKLKRDPPSYFFGTIHVPYNRVWNYISDSMKLAFQQSDSVFFELDLTDPYTMTALANCQLLPHGENISNILPKDVYTRLKNHLQYVRENMQNWITADQKGKGLYADYLFDVIAGNWERKRPIWVMLLVNSLTESDIKSREVPVLDLFLAQEAERLHKITGAIERVEEQCVPLNDLDFSQVVFALNQTLWQHETHRLANSTVSYTTDDLIYHYNCGDLNEIIFSHDSRQVQNLMNASLPPNDLKTAKLIDNYFKTELINKRNERMSYRVAELLNENPEESFFFAFGAGHFLGNNTVVDQLHNMGFDIEHMIPDTEIQKQQLQRHPRNRVQEDFGDIWDQMDEESRNWLMYSRTERRKSYHSDKPFNDLWIQVGTPRPGLLQHLARMEQTPPTSPAFIQHFHNSQPVAIHLSPGHYAVIAFILYLIILP